MYRGKEGSHWFYLCFGATLAIATVVHLSGLVPLGSDKTIGAAADTACKYDIELIGNELVPMRNGERVGFFEKHSNGDVQLTYGDGFSPKANDCIEKSGFADRIAAISPYK
ncbi:hypothetical protein [Comamonas jiangduensis]|uniref:hypothetical protein n=1 Tax=Comamonas jiangduensis TaxID=1194168 RepID=UPI003BF8A97F